MTIDMNRRRAITAALGVLGWLGRPRGGSATGGRGPQAPQPPVPPQDPIERRDDGDAGSLNYPWAVGRPRARVVAGDNDPFVIAVEERIKCTCSCAHSLYTCRTTDFNCQFWQPLHAQVIDMAERNMAAQEIVDAYAAQHGTEFLMAPPPAGFNLAGYLLPGVVITSIAGAMLWVLRRRTLASTLAPVVADGFSDEERTRLDAALENLET